MIKRIVIITSLLVIGLILTGCTKFPNQVGNINNVSEKIITNNGHSEEDIKKTFEIIKKDFNSKDFKGCELLTLTYGKEPNINDIENELVKNNNATEAIILYFTFKTGNSPEINFNPNNEYVYSAEFIKVDNQWKKINWGQG